MKLKYVGLKAGGESAFQAQTGIYWMPGDVKEVANPATAAKMLQHPDVFAPADGEALTSTASPLEQTAPKTEPQLEGGDQGKTDGEGNDDPVAAFLDTLSDDEVRAYATSQSITIRGLNLMKGLNLRSKVLAAIEAKPE
jgi:hypothetical protein